MKKGVKTALISALAVLFILGCEDLVYEGASVNYSGLDQSNDSTNYDKRATGPILTLTPPAIFSVTNLVASSTPGGTKNELVIDLQTTNQIDIESFKRAIKIYQLENADNAWDYKKRGAEIGIERIAQKPESLNLASVYLAGITTGTSPYFEIELDAGILTGRKGALKLDRDFDSIPGESGDDNVYLYNASAITGTTGSVPVGLNRRSDIFADLSYLSSSFTVSGPGEINLQYRYVQGNPFNSPALLIPADGADASDYAGLFSGNLVVQKYSDNAGWTDISTDALAYNTATQQVTLRWSPVAARDLYRVVARNSQTFTTLKNINGQPRKFPPVRGKDEQILTSAPYYYAVADPEEFPSTGLFNPASVAVASDANRYNVVAVARFNLANTGNLGVDENLFKANAKLVKRTGNGSTIPYQYEIISIKEIEFRKSDIFSATLKCNDEVVIYLPDNFKKPASSTSTYSLYVGPEARTRGEEGGGSPGARRLGDFTAYNLMPEIKYYRSYLTITGL
jgi:hypothetical protein